MASWGDWAQILPIIAPIHRKSYGVKLLISHQMKPYSSVKGHLRVNLYIFLYLWNWVSWQNLAQLSQIMGRDTQKVIQSVKFHISHQIKPYSRVKTIWWLIYTCFSILVKLGQIWPKYPTSWTLVHRKSFKVLNITFYIKWSLTQG